jgi:membrane associated rhomboid family serine protease
MHAPFGNGTGIMHILFNMMTLWSFSFLERLLGGKRFLILYFLSGLGAYFLFNAWEFIQVQQITSQLESYGFNVSNFLAEGKGTMRGTKISIDQQNILVEKLKDIVASPMLGASGAIFGVVAAFATIFPDEKLIIMFIPYPIKAKYLLIGTMVISVFLGVMGNVGGIAHFAHVGGALVGFLLAKMWKNHLNRFNQQ